MKYLVVGYYGYGNTGDDDLLRQTVKLLRNIDSMATISVAFKERPSSELPDGTTPTNRFSIEIIQSIFHSHAVIFGGGGIFQDQTSLKSLVYYSTLIGAAKLFRKPVFLLGQGFSRPSQKISTYILKWTLSKCSWIGCRDDESLFELRKNVNPRVGTLTGDLAFYLRPPTIKQIVPPHHTIGISIRNENQKLRSEIITHFIGTTTDRLIGLTLQSPDDDHALMNIWPMHRDQRPAIVSLHNDFPNVPTDMECPTIVIAMRYHACIWATLNGIPFIGLGYDDKVISLASALNMPSIDLRESNWPMIINDLVNQIKTNYRTYQEALLDKGQRIVALATHNEDGVADWLKIGH